MICKNRLFFIRELNDELDTETKGEPSLLAEVEKLQRDVDQARTRAQLTTHSSDVLHSQVNFNVY